MDIRKYIEDYITSKNKNCSIEKQYTVIRQIYDPIFNEEEDIESELILYIPNNAEPKYIISSIVHFIRYDIQKKKVVYIKVKFENVRGEKFKEVK